MRLNFPFPNSWSPIPILDIFVAADELSDDLESDRQWVKASL